MIDIIIFVGLCVGLFASFLAAIKYYWYIGPIAGLFGAVYTLEIYRTGPDLILRTFIASDNSLVYQTMPLGLFFYVPLILSFMCFAAALKHNKK